MTDAPAPAFQVDDLVIVLGRVAALPAEGGLVPVETSTGGFVWLMPAECEAIPQDEVIHG